MGMLPASLQEPAALAYMTSDVFCRFFVTPIILGRERLFGFTDGHIAGLKLPRAIEVRGVAQFV